MAYDWRTWNVFSKAIIADWERVRTRFPVELDGSTILCPHLYGFRTATTRPTRKSDDGDDFYTETRLPDFMVFAGSGAAHLEFLRAEVVPLAQRRVPHVVVADIDTFTYEEHLPGSDPLRIGPLGELPSLLNDWLGERLVLPSGLDPLAHPLHNRTFKARCRRARSDVLAAMADMPLRLWEAFLLRGHSYRWELINGEVPLVGELPTPLLANRSLLQCVADAEALEGSKAVDEAPWIRVGRYRLRQREALLEIRVRMTPPDARVAFLPSHREPGSAALPTLAGVMLAGGPKGKTEMFDGYTDSSVLCATPDEAERLAESLRSTLLERCGALDVRVRRGSDEWGPPPCESGIWGIAIEDRYLTLQAPVFHGGVALVFDIFHGDYWEPDPAPPIAFLSRHEDDATEKVAAAIDDAFNKGSREVWVTDYGESPHVAVFRAPDKSEVYRSYDVIPGSETFARAVPVSAFLRSAVEAEMLEILIARRQGRP